MVPLLFQQSNPSEFPSVRRCWDGLSTHWEYRKTAWAKSKQKNLNRLFLKVLLLPISRSQKIFSKQALNLLIFLRQLSKAAKSVFSAALGLEKPLLFQKLSTTSLFLTLKKTYQSSLVLVSGPAKEKNYSKHSSRVKLCKGLV